MDASITSQPRANAMEMIQHFRVPDLQALLEFARLPRQGYKRDLLLRCKLLISSKWSPQLANRIQQINLARRGSTRVAWPVDGQYPNQSLGNSSIVLPPTSPVAVLPSPNHVQYVRLPFFDVIRTIDCTNIPVNRKAFPPLSFLLTDFDVDFILRGTARVLLRLAPTNTSERQNDVLPPYLFVQCNDQTVIDNNVAKPVGAQAHSIAFPTDLTEKMIPKSKVPNVLHFFWIQSPLMMSFKNLAQSYTLTIQLVRCISLESLCADIVRRESPILKSADKTNEVEIDDIGFIATRHRVSLLCPITQSLIVLPVKSSFCSHLTCFDLRPFLQMNQHRVKWTCPLCKKSAAYETLHIDQRLQTILSDVPPNCSTVELDSSADNYLQYIFDTIKQDKSDLSRSLESQPTASPQAKQTSPIDSRRASIESNCVVISSGSEDEDENENPPTRSAPIDSHLSSLPCSISSDLDDGTLWEDIAKFAYDFIADHQDKRQGQKRKTTPLASNNNQQRKRAKRTSTSKSRSTEIDVITLSSSDSEDHCS